MDEIKIRRHSPTANTSFPNHLYNMPTIFYQRYGFSIGYVILGFLLIFTVILIFNTYVLHLKVETSVVNIPIETMVAPEAGIISNVYVKPGAIVKKGDFLITIDNLQLSRDYELALIQVEDAKLAIAHLENLLSNEKQKMNFYQDVGENRVVAAKAEVNLSKQEVLAAKNNLERMRLLLKKRYITPLNWEEARTQYLHAEEKMKNATAKENINNHSLAAVDQGLYFTGEKLEGNLPDLNAELIVAKKRLALNEYKANVYKAMLHKLTLIAPFDGKISQVLKSVGSTTDSVKPIILIEQSEGEKTIVSYLTQKEIIHINVHSPVKIYIPALGKMYHGKIINVDRTAGFIDEINAQFRWRDLEVDRSGRVIIAINDKNINKKLLSGGLPAIVYFSRKFSWF